MLRHNTSGEDAVRNAIHQADIRERREQAKREDSALIRAAAAAGRDSRAIGTTRRAYSR
ncbi:hypothetical protein [Mangrovihabitans endophyticus]|uniref:Uncharacterized protein n=1 Tax=Mangrovihabitans endophyticus TaxID=1751298 RepID=A0A8J3C4F0_9ACTN|nr:hypothetical protein [Mangrovihabitans endophyticus]GGL16330.1 hypothetical protein GCM10012284_58660 [Mangrovihabitans endophyticus]